MADLHPEPHPLRRGLKRALAALGGRGEPQGATLLIYHRVGGGTSDELDLPTAQFELQLDLLAGHDVVSLDTALDRLDAGDASPSVVLTFDDGFEDVYQNAWPLLRDRGLPFSIYLASAFVGATMRWEGSTAAGAPGRGLTWDQLAEMVESGLCTVGNHTHRHVRPQEITAAEVDECSNAVYSHLGVTPQHFTYPWGIIEPTVEPLLRERFRSASTGELGRNLPETDRMRLVRIPVRQSDPPEFFDQKFSGSMVPERVYGLVVAAAKMVQSSWRWLSGARVESHSRFAPGTRLRSASQGGIL